MLARLRGALGIWTVALILLAGAVSLAACGDDGDTGSSEVTNPSVETTEGEQTDTDQSDTTETETTEAEETDLGGTLAVATEAFTNRDPAFASARSDILLNQQIYDWLVEVGDENELLPGLATEWDSPDGRVWTFLLRPDVVFSNGAALTADDVVYTFDRLRDPELGSPGVDLYGNVADIRAAGGSAVEFTLTEPDPEFASSVADYHAAILSRDVLDPAAEWVGTGPFVLSDYSAEDRAVLTKNPAYWRLDDQDQALPYLDELQLIVSPDLAGQVQALRGDQVQFVAGLTAELVTSIEDDENLQVLTGPASAFHYVIHMRSDEGRPTADERVRQALQLGTDHQGLIDQIRPGLAVVGNGTPVGPIYGDYYLDETPVYAPEEAKRLLAEAGYEGGLDITLYAQQALEVPAIATVWQQQMQAIDVNVQIQTVPPDVYYSEGDASWLTVDFGITEWGARPTPNAYFNAAYTTSASWNESHWSDREFDALVEQINTELDRQTRAELYKQAQRILIERGPVIVPFFETAAAGVSAAVEGLSLPADWSRTSFMSAKLVR